MTEAPVIQKVGRHELQEAFREYESGVYHGNARRTAVFAAIFMLLGSSLDWVIVPERGLDFLIIRCICAALLVLVFWYLEKSRSVGSTVLVSHAIGLLPLVSICIMIGVTDGGNSVYYAGLNLILVGLSLLFRWPFWNMLGMVCLTYVMYEASVMISPVTPDFQIRFGNSFFLLVTSVFVVAGSYYYEKLRFSEFCLRAEVEKSRALLEAQNLQLSKLDEAKTRFIANISHELRTPLTITLGITERLRSEFDKQPAVPRMREMTLMLEQNGLRLLKLIDDLLELVRFDTGHAHIKRNPTVIGEHLNGLLVSVSHLAEQDHLSLHWDCETDHDVVLFDRDKFDKILLNLVINAIKFTPAYGSIHVKVNVSGNRLLLTVEDTGVGIPSDDLPRIFERFWQVDSSSTRKFQGAGIGLALVRSLCDAMGGEVDVESRINHGSRFSVSLPVETGNADLLVDGGELESLVDGGNIANIHRRAAMFIPGKLAGQGDADTPALDLTRVRGIRHEGGSRPLVMIADDEPDIRRFLKMQFEDVDLIEAADGVEALRLVGECHPQLVLLDHMMPGMNGVEVCRRIRANPATQGVAVIVLTARADETTRLQALQAGASDFLTKPFSTAELALRLDNQITMARIRGDLAELNGELQSALVQIKENEVLMLRNEKLSALGRMSAGIIHEINNPLNYAGAGLHALEPFAKMIPASYQSDYVDILKDIREGVERVSQIVIDLRKFTRDDKSLTDDVDLVEIVTRARRMVAHQTGRGIGLNLEAPDLAPITGNSNQLVQVFINLFQNSIDAIQMRVTPQDMEPGRIDISITHVENAWRVTVRDNGIGIPPEDLEKVFDPFFTSKDVGKGMGLGLSITHQILKSHHVVVHVDSRPAGFTRFQMDFPTPDPATSSEGVP